MKQNGKVYMTPSGKFIKLHKTMKGWATYESYTYYPVDTIEQATVVGVDMKRPLTDIRSKKSWDMCLDGLQYLDVEVSRVVEIVKKGIE